MMLRALSMIVVSMSLFLVGCATVVPPPVVAPASATDAEAAWGRVLQRFVNERGEVDFQALSQDRSDLDRYVRYVADAPLAEPGTGGSAQAAQLAHMINAYNALSMFNVVASGIPATHAGFNKVGFFYLRKLAVGGQVMSLYAFENEVIRPFTRRIGEPRVHFALNCSARACPVLPRVPFSGPRLGEQLERETRAFFAQPRNFRIDDATRTVWLSEILNFYPEDFVPEHAPSLVAYANRYAPQAAPLDYTLRLTPYDWTVANSQAR